MKYANIKINKITLKITIKNRNKINVLACDWNMLVFQALQIKYL